MLASSLNWRTRSRRASGVMTSLLSSCGRAHDGGAVLPRQRDADLARQARPYLRRPSRSRSGRKMHRPGHPMQQSRPPHVQSKLFLGGIFQGFKRVLITIINVVLILANTNIFF